MPLIPNRFQILDRFLDVVAVAFERPAHGKGQVAVVVLGEGGGDLSGRVAFVGNEDGEHHFFSAGTDEAAEIHGSPVGFLVFVVDHVVVIAHLISSEINRLGF